MSLIPLLDLPILPIELILLGLPACDVIDFTLCSKKCKRIVKSMRYPYTGIDINVDYNRFINLKIGEDVHFQWSFRLDPLPRGVIPFESDLKTIGGTKMIALKNDWLFESTKTPENNMKIAYNYLREIFKLPVLSFDFDTQINRKSLPHGFGFTKCEKLRIETRKRILKKHIQYIFDNVEVSKYLFLDIPDSQIDSTVQFSVDQLNIRNSQWITRDTFLSLDCARIDLYRTHLTTKDFEDFITQWLNSTDTRLEWAKIYTENENRQLVDLENKFQAKPWDPSVRGQYYEHISHNEDTRRKLDCIKGMDIIRSDGLMATCMHTGYWFRFVVWHNTRFPKLDHIPYKTF